MATNHKDDKASPLITKPLGELLRLSAGQVDMTAFDPAATPGFPGDKQDAPEITDALAPELSDLQERFYAAGRVKETTSQKILVVLQGMDTSGKGGVIRHAIGMIDPQGVKIKAFKAPTETERAQIVAAAREAWETANFASAEDDYEIWKEIFGPRFKVED